MSHMGWTVFVCVAIYVAVAVAYGIRVARQYIDGRARSELDRRMLWLAELGSPHSDANKPLVDRSDRADCVFGGLLVGLVWPLSAPIRALVGNIEAPTETAERERVELAALRKQARELGLPMPGSDR